MSGQRQYRVVVWNDRTESADWERVSSAQRLADHVDRAHRVADEMDEVLADSVERLVLVGRL